MVRCGVTRVKKLTMFPSSGNMFKKLPCVHASSMKAMSGFSFIVFIIILMQEMGVLSLRFSSHGSFTILQVSDMHFAQGALSPCLDVPPSFLPHCSDLNTIAFFNKLIASELPDLIVFTGDSIFGRDTPNHFASLDACFAPAIHAQIPWAAVLGNHDQEMSSRKEIMEHIVRMERTLSQLYPDGNSSLEIDGFGNYNLEVGGVLGTELEGKSVLNLYFLDSGDYSPVRWRRGYGWIRESQIRWFQQRSLQLQSMYKSSPLPQQISAPGLVFFHIPLPEVKELSKGHIIGVQQEEVGCPRVNSGFLEAMEAAGDVKAAFFGHDHRNDFCGEMRGVKLCYGGGFGYHAYGKEGWERRARVVQARLERGQNGEGWGGVAEIKTWKRLDDEHLSKVDEMVVWVENGQCHSFL